MARWTTAPFLIPDDEGKVSIPFCSRLLTIPDERRVALESRVRQYVHLKHKKRPFHEIVVFEVDYDFPDPAHEGSITTFLVIDRCCGFYGGISRPRPSRSFFFNPSASFSGCKANDVAWFPGPRTREQYSYEGYVELLCGRGYRRLRTARLSTHMSAAQLFVMTQILHDEKPAYKVLDGQCYWLAGMLWEMIRKKFGVSMIVVEKTAKAGTFSGLKITRIGLAEVEGVLGKFDEAWTSFANREVSVRLSIIELPSPTRFIVAGSHGTGGGAQGFGGGA